MNKVLLEKHDGYAILTLNRPEAMNAMSRELREDFTAAFADCSADPAIRVVIVTGSGKAFSAGMDLKELSDPDAGSADETGDNIMARAVEAFEGPVIAAVNGHAVTAGFELTLACDVIIASENARFADTHARVGILPGWGLSQRLPRLIGLSRAKQLSFTGMPLFAEQACDWGLVNFVVPAEQLLESAQALAREMCACVPDILVRYKRLIDEGYSMPLNEALPWEEAIAIASASEVGADLVAQRREGIFGKGRSEKSE